MNHDAQVVTAALDAFKKCKRRRLYEANFMGEPLVAAIAAAAPYIRAEADEEVAALKEQLREAREYAKKYCSDSKNQPGLMLMLEDTDRQPGDFIDRIRRNALARAEKAITAEQQSVVGKREFARGLYAGLSTAIDILAIEENSTSREKE